jgi:tRNA(Ile)-lysidine synthase
MSSVSTSTELISKVDRTLRRLEVSEAGMVVAVSGGPDSVALLNALLRLRATRPAPLIIAHLNHQLRGAEADADEAFVRELHATLVARGHKELPLCCIRIDVGGRAAATKSNIEATGRQERYHFLSDVAREHGLKLVATGHTADDQAETILHRLLRGAGLQGLRGIAEKRPLTEGVEVVRPMLDVTRAEVLRFLEEEDLPTRQDSTNADMKFTRNRIRHQLLPYLVENFNPAIQLILGRLASEAAEAFEGEQAGVLALLREAELPRSDSQAMFQREQLKIASRRRVRLMFRHVWTREGWPAGGMGMEHWRRVEAVVFDDLTAVDLPNRMHARRHGSVIQVGPWRSP